MLNRASELGLAPNRVVRKKRPELTNDQRQGK